MAFYNNEPVAFCAVLHLPHGIVKNVKRCSRIVVMPDYQGVGIGTKLLNWVADYYISKGFRFTITTTTPALMHSFKKSYNWKLKRQGRSGNKATSKSKIEQAKQLAGTDSTRRITTSWEYSKK